MLNLQVNKFQNIYMIILKSKKIYKKQTKMNLSIKLENYKLENLYDIKY